MSRVCYFLAAILFSMVPICASAQVNSGSAPADEYFGPHHHSILEIRNRLHALERKSNDEMLEPNVVVGIDDLDVSILAWQRAYPADPWLPTTFEEVLEAYQRADDVSSPRAMATLAVMRSAYPDARQTSRTVAAIYGSQPLPIEEAAVQTPVADVSTPSLPAGSPEWSRFNSLRYGSGDGQYP